MIKIMNNSIKTTFIVLMTLQIACNWSHRRMEVADVRSKQTLVFVSKEKYPSGYQLTIQSDIDGDVSILQGMNEVLHLPKGNSTMTVRSDQYSDTLRLEYVPNSVTRGKVVIDYNF